MTDCKCYLGNKCTEEYNIDRKDVTVGLEAFLVKPEGDMPEEITKTIEGKGYDTIYNNNTGYSCFAHIELSPGKWIMKVNATHHFPKWIGICYS